MTTLIFTIIFCGVAVFVYMARYSGRLRVAETRLIDASVAEVYAKVADFRHWGEWSPWLEHDPEATVTLSDMPDREGSRYAWEGGRIGAGAIEHVLLIPQARIEQSLHCLNPFRFHGRGSWQFAERDGKTEVIWSLKGRVGFALRAFAQTVQGAIALDYRYGLDKIARLVEPADSESAVKHYSLDYLGVREVPKARYVYCTYRGPLKGIGEAMHKGFAELREELACHGLQAVGNPIAVYVETNIKLRTTVCHMGLLIDDPTFERMPVRERLAHRAYVVGLRGSYAALEIAWYEAMQRMRVDKLQPDQRIPPFECYLSPPKTPENQLLTELHIPLRQPA